jgi:hypothetical protein
MPAIARNIVAVLIGYPVSFIAGYYFRGKDDAR